MKNRRSESGGGSKTMKAAAVSGGAAHALWLLLPLFFLVVLKTDFLPQIARHLDRERWNGEQKPMDVVAAGSRSANDSPASTGDQLPSFVDHHHDDLDVNRDSKQQKEIILATNGKVDGSLLNSDVGAPRSKLSCNFSSYRMSTCAMEGDVRVHGKSATVYVVASDGREENATTTIRPYPRKWESTTMTKVREVTVRSSAPGVVTPPPPRCTVSHDVPAVIFSTGGYSSNYFHSMTDIVVPLYITAREYDGRVQLLATDYDQRWITKYSSILAALSVYPVIDFDGDVDVRCFPTAHVGIESHRELGITPALSPRGYTMMDFRDFLRSAYSLKRSWATPISRESGEKPRLVMLLRRHSRELTNEAEAISAASEAGFEVVTAGPEEVRDMASFAGVVNSCHVMVGVHGAGLTNMVFLPHNGTVVQIIPWGGMKWPCWHAFGQPAPDMGLRYVEYEATAEETTLKEIYPRDHVVFTDPLAIHRQGFSMIWKTFLDGQNVTLDIDRFRETMKQVYQSVTLLS